VANDEFITIFTDDSTVTGTDIKVLEFTTAADKFEDLATAANDTPNDTVINEIDLAAPVIVDATLYDTNGNGNIDEIFVEFSEPMDDASVTTNLDALQFNFGGNLASGVDDVTFSSSGNAINHVGGDPGTIDDQYMTIFTDDSSTTGTGTSAVTFLTQSDVFEDLATAANDSPTDSTITEIDLAKPVILSAASSLSISAGNVPITTVFTLTYSEPMAANVGATTTIGEFSFPTATTGSATFTFGASASTVTITFDTATDTADWASPETINMVLPPSVTTVKDTASPANVAGAAPSDVTISGLAPFACGDTIDDADTNTYNTFLIGTQCWTATNMRTTKYPDNSAITKGNIGHGTEGGAGALTWGDDTSLYSCPPNGANNAEDCNAAYPTGIDASPAGGTTGTGEEFGLLYQWSTTMDGEATCNGTGAGQPKCSTPVQGICPDSWHIPSHYEWTALELEVCDSGSCATDFPYDTTTTGLRGTDEGTKLKDGGSSSFEGHLTGLRLPTSNYTSRTSDTIFWSSTDSSGNAWRRNLVTASAQDNRGTDTKAHGLNVRCIADSLTADSTAPTIVDATLYDMDKDGNIDEILIEFSEYMMDASITANGDAGQFDFGGTVAIGIDDTTLPGSGNTSLNTGDPDVANDRFITIFTDDTTVTRKA